jgi:hypothetical protein
MEELFTISLMYKGQEQELTGRLRVSAYTHQFLFSIGDSEIILERDDEGHFRALMAPGEADRGKKTDEGFIRALIAELEKNL